MYHSESTKILTALKSDLPSLTGSVVFQLGKTQIKVNSKDGIGGLIEEWFGVWAQQKSFNIINPKLTNSSQNFPDYYIGNDHHYLEIKSFDFSASPNFDIANFESYCESLANNPARLDADYLIFGYTLDQGVVTIKDIWLKKIWEITCSSERWPLKTQTKRDVIYNIRPATWYSDKTHYHTFSNQDDFVNALYETQEQYNGKNNKELFLKNSSSSK